MNLLKISLEIVFTMSLVILIFIVITAISSIFFTKDTTWRPWMEDEFFLNETLPLIRKIEYGSRNSLNVISDIQQLSIRCIDNPKNFLWAWNYSIENHFNEIQKILIKLSNQIKNE
jgi:hypothetical protein